MVDPQPDATRHIPAPYTVNAMDMMLGVQRAHVSLSQMADQKASILMGATFVIFTIAIGRADGAGAPVPLMVLGAFAFVSAVLAILAVLPAAGPGRTGRMNLLFFGSFTRLGEEEYIDQLCQRMKNDDLIFETFARDIYQNGKVLADKKYRLLGHAYRVFLVGMTASLIAFVAQLAGIG